MDFLILNETFGAVLTSPLVRVLMTVCVVLALQLLLRRVIKQVVIRAVHSGYQGKKADEIKRENTLISVFRTAAAFVLWTIGLIVIMSQLHINLGALATGAGLIGVIVGFGAQSTIKDILGGVFIIAENQYRVGDIVTLKATNGEVSGLVEDITVRITRLRDLDGNLHIVANGSIGIVTNLSFDYANVNIDVRVAYDADIAKVEKVINQVGLAMLKDAEFGVSILEPIQFLRVDGFEDYAVRIKALGKVEPAKQWDIAGLFRRQLVTAFAEAHLTIPLPQVVVHNAKKTTSSH